MRIKTLKTTETTNNIVVLADMHINSSLSEDFERNRINILSEKLHEFTKRATIIIAGDTFDRNTPSLIDIAIFYKFISDLKVSYLRDIYVIGGNHDSTTFNYLPSSNFIHISEPTIINNKLCLVPWTHIKQIPDISQDTNELILVSHARCTIPPYIVEEVNIKQLSDSFKLVVLGDIHTQPTLPFNNVKYCTSPSNVSFTVRKEKAHGFILLNTIDMESTHISLRIPSKTVRIAKDFDECVAIIGKHSRSKSQDYMKVKFEGTAEELRELSKLPSRNVVKDFIVQTSTIHSETAEDASDSLKDFLNSKISMSEFAFTFFHKSLKIPEDVVNLIKQRYEEIKTSKGAH